MENASKALLIAGGVMLTMIVISLFLYTTSSISEYQAMKDAITKSQRTAEFNSGYTNYERDNLQGYELLSLVNKVIDYNQRYSYEFDSTKAIGNNDQYEPISCVIKLDSSSRNYTNRNKFTTRITVPATAKNLYKDKEYDQIKNNSSYRVNREVEYNGANESIRLFKENEYKQSNAVNKFSGILNIINNIESDWGGAKNAQNVTKNITTLFASKILFYNGRPSDIYEEKNWYQQSYVENRYKALTKNNLSVDNIRSERNLKNALQYYEFVEFKKAKFKCTGVTYSKQTGRITGISFEIKE